MYKILVLGSTGLLGNAVDRHFRSLNDFLVVSACRDVSISQFAATSFDALSDSLEKLSGDYEYVLNCVGIIKPFMLANPMAAICINALFPWQLAEWCSKNGYRLIHITTDCVYSGAKGQYVESDVHDALDAYGKTKSLGECPETAMVLRTSIIGNEIHKNASLIAWAKSQKGKKVKGYATHFWNGVTTDFYAKICEKIIRNDWHRNGLFHIHAANDVSKLEMLQMFNKKFNLDLEIESASPQKVDRTLRSDKELCRKLEIPTVEKMVEEIR